MSGHSFSLKLTEDEWALAVDALQLGADESADPDWSQDCSNLAVLLRHKIDTVMIAATGAPIYGACDTITKATR